MERAVRPAGPGAGGTGRLAAERAAVRIDLAAVEASLRRVQREFARINERLRSRPDLLDDRVVDNLLAGYALVDALVADGVDLFAMGQLKHWLELNTLVLCGTSAARRGEYAGHLAATERRFYDTPAAGIQDVVEWHARHRGESAWSRAAGVYVRILGKPQLFIEGNHRTGSLVMSYLLLRDGHPPFVLSVDNAAAYFAPSSVLRDSRKGSAAMLLRSPWLRRRLAALLRANADLRYLRAAG